MGLLDRFKQDGQEQQREQLEPIEPQASSDNPSRQSASASSGGENDIDRTSEWFSGGLSGGPDQDGAQTVEAGSIQPLTDSVPFEIGSASPISSSAGTERTKPLPKQVSPVSEEQLDELMKRARRSRSARDIEAVWDAIMTRPELVLLQRVKGHITEPHAIDSPFGPMLLWCTSKVRVQTLLSTPPFRKLPYAWKAASMPLEKALDWAIRQRAGGVEAIEINRSTDPGFATLLQLLPERFERVHGRPLEAAPLIAPDFEAMGHRMRLDPSAANHIEFHKAFYNLQRWFAIRDPKRADQPAFAPINDKPVLMLFTSRAEAEAGAKTVGRDRDWPKALMTIDPKAIVNWMCTLPENGVTQALVNHGSAPFVLELGEVASQWGRYRR